ncbi:MAG TPA: hypothetical protein VIJ65_06135 [Acidobacteriaceae bacterium]
MTAASVDAHIGYRVVHPLDLLVDGRDPSAEFAGDPCGATGIYHGVAGGLTWGR